MMNLNQPDPAWDYAEFWAITLELAKNQQALQSLLADSEYAHPEIEYQLMQYFRAIKEQSDRAIELLVQEARRL
jgi:hypothetical protein